MLEVNKIYNLDCIDFLNKIENESINLAIIDPPYNLAKDKWDKFADEVSFFKFTENWIDALIPKLKTNGSLYIFNTPYNCAFILAYLVRKNLIFQNWITWDKRDGFSSRRRKYNSGQETILFFTNGKNHVFNYDDIRVQYDSKNRIAHAKRKGILKNGKRWFPNPGGKLCGEVWHIASERHKNKVNGKLCKMPHATPKPLELVERIVKASSNEGDIVLDCFVGIGTTAIAAKRLNRHFVCNDFSKGYVHIAKKTLRETFKEDRHEQSTSFR